MKLGRSLRCGAGSLAAVVLLACAATSLADRKTPWPKHSVRIVVGYAPGSSPDTLARMLADPLGRALGKPIVVENRPGAGGNLGVETVLKSTDGHTFGLTTFGPLTTSRLLFKKLPYDPARDVLAISLLVTSPLVLVCDSDLPPTSLKDFVAWANGQVTTVAYGSAGIGTGSHLMMESFARSAHIHLAHVPYQSIPQVTTALLSHQVQAAFMPPSGALAQSEAGKLRILAISSGQRWPQRPEIPTLAEQTGISDLQGEVWMAAFGPTAMPAEIAMRLSAEIKTVLMQPDIRQRLHTQGWEALGRGPEELRIRMADDTAVWARVIREAKVPKE